MRKLFSQKSKNKTSPGSSLVMPLLPFNKANEKEITEQKSNSASNYTTSENKIQVITDDSISTEISINHSKKQDDNGEKMKKLFVVVSGKYF
jgi:hypothetical protein